MAAKFGSSGTGMAGVGSDSSYDPNSGYGYYGSGFDVDNMVSEIGSAFATLGAYGQQSMNTISTYANDPNLTKNVTATGASLWSSIATSVSEVASAIADPDSLNEHSEEDGLVEFQRRMHEERQNRAATGSSSSRYSGFGSDDVMSGKVNTSSIGASKISQSSQEAENDMMTFNQWDNDHNNNDDSFTTTTTDPTTTTKSAPPSSINHNDISTTTTTGTSNDSSKTKKIEGTGDEFFSNFGA